MITMFRRFRIGPTPMKMGGVAGCITTLRPAQLISRSPPATLHGACSTSAAEPDSSYASSPPGYRKWKGCSELIPQLG